MREQGRGGEGDRQTESEREKESQAVSHTAQHGARSHDCGNVTQAEIELDASPTEPPRPPSLGAPSLN